MAQTKPKKLKKRHTKLGKALALIATIILVTIAVLAFLYKDRLSPEFLGQLAGNDEPSFTNAEPFTYENGSNQVFALMGSNLAVASSTGLQILDENGITLARQVFSMTNPAVCTGDAVSVFYDVGGTALRIFKNGECTQYDRESPIISVTVNNSGFVTVCEERVGYKGSVFVYNPDMELLYTWYSGAGYTLDAVLSPNSSELSVLCLEQTGSIVHIFRLNSEDEFGSVSFPNELAFKLHYTRDGRICVLSENALHFYASDNERRSTYDFNGDFLVDYELSDDIYALVLSKYVSGSEVSLISFGVDGKVLGTVPLSEEPLSLSSQKQKLLVHSSNNVVQYSRELRPLKESGIVPGYKQAVLRPQGDVLLLASHYGEKCELK
ncbi:MAG: DUF5711 family protein [Oscillospiraceae bacterium]